MSAENKKAKLNFMRRGIGLFLGLLPLLLLMASIGYGFIHNARPKFAAVGWIIAAAVIALSNFHLSFIRPRIYFYRHGSMEGYHFVSGVPVVGTFLILFGALFSFGAIGTAIFGIVAYVIDTGGFIWFTKATWRDRSFWDSEKL